MSLDVVVGVDDAAEMKAGDRKVLRRLVVIPRWDTDFDVIPGNRPR